MHFLKNTKREFDGTPLASLCAWLCNKEASWGLKQVPTADEPRQIYSADSLIPCVGLIIMGYNRKIDLLGV